MRRQRGLWAVICLLAIAPHLAAQIPDPSHPSEDSRLGRLEKRLDEMEKRQQTERKTRDDEIARLKALLGHLRVTSARGTSSPGDAASCGGGGGSGIAKPLAHLAPGHPHGGCGAGLSRLLPPSG